MGSEGEGRRAVQAPAILFFDGVCTLCNGFVDFVIRRDHRGRFRFAPLQGQTAARLLPAERTEKIDTFVLHIDGAHFVRSTAALKVLSSLGGLWVLMKVFLLIPVGLRDLLYRWLSTHRYRLFGRKDSCRLPTAAERARFLD